MNEVESRYRRNQSLLQLLLSHGIQSRIREAALVRLRGQRLSGYELKLRNMRGVRLLRAWQTCRCAANATWRDVIHSCVVRSVCVQCTMLTSYLVLGYFAAWSPALALLRVFLSVQVGLWMVPGRDVHCCGGELVNQPTKPICLSSRRTGTI